MKKMKKLITLVLALVMVMSLATTAMAAANVDNKTDHSYNAYQIFSGSQADNNPALGTVEWGSGIVPATFLDALKDDDRFVKDEVNIFDNCGTAKAVADVLADNPDVADAFANVAADNLTTTSTPIAADAQSVDLAAGYYLLVDTTDVAGENDAKNSALLQVTQNGDVQIREKYDVPTPDKKITEVYHLETATDLVDTDAVDVEMGDVVEFTLTGTMPSNYADYESYVYNFHDNLSAGLAYQNDAEVYVVNGATETKVTDSFTVQTGTNVTCTKGDCNLYIACSNLKAIPGITATSTIKVVYTAKLEGKDVVMGANGNPNEMYIEYSNNPNKDSDGTPDTGDTPKDKVLVFTYVLDVTKVDGADTSKKLKNAEFVLLNEDTDMVATVDANGKLTGWVDVPDEVDGKITWPANTKLTSDAQGKFIVQGLDSATYYLRETKAPDGYNPLTADVKVVITATVNGDEGSEQLEALNIKVDNNEVADGDVDRGIVSATIENNLGGTLPETGGMGTTLFYVFGAVMVMGAAVLLVTKKRMAR